MTRFPVAAPLTPSTATLRVLHIPGEHSYVRHLRPAGEHNELFRTLPDPTPPPVAGSWRPSVVLDPSWVAAHAGTFDVVHLHFGYEHLTPAEVTGWAAAVHRAGAALVVTVHDIDNPHLADQRGHHANLRAVLAAADRIITLTPGAAALLRQRWGHEAAVIPHPHLLPIPLIGSRATPRSPGAPRIGVPLGAVRANVDAAAVLRWLTHWPGPAPVVRVDRRLFDAAQHSDRRSLRAQLTAGADRGDWTLDRVEPGVPDEILWQWLSALDAVVLPYRWGTHSGWVEAGADVGTSVIAPALGFWAEQRAVLTVPPWSAAGADDAADVHRRLTDRQDPAGAGLGAPTSDDRIAQRNDIHRRHAEIYGATVFGSMRRPG